MAKDSQETGKYWNDPWNPWYGCNPKGAGCLNCWAKANHERWGSAKHPPAVFSYPFNELHIFPERLDIPLRRKKPTVYSVCFASDPYHEKVPDDMLDKVKAVEALCPQHTFIELTKRWERRAEYHAAQRSVGERRYADGTLKTYSTHGRVARLAYNAFHRLAWEGKDSWRLPRTACGGGDAIVFGERGAWPLPNAWQGVSVSTQAELDAARPYLLATPAAVRVLSAEPLLEGLELSRFFYGSLTSNIHWVIVGCETGPNRRPCPIEHIKSVAAQVKAAGCALWVKAVEINGRVSHDMSEWPESIRFRELPK
jgi:protein gp37